MLIIGLGYRARQGKNTAAQAALESLPLDCEVRLYAFADALKMEVRKACAVMGGQYELIEASKASGWMPKWVHFEDPKPRSLLQWWGTDYRRKQNPFYWVDKLDATLRAHNPEVAFIPDVRNPNEGDYIHANDGYLVKVVNTGAVDVEVNDHESEHAMDDYTAWDFVIEAATAAECKRKAVEIFAEIRRRHGK